MHAEDNELWMPESGDQEFAEADSFGDDELGIFWSTSICGNGICDWDEDCYNCPADCGPCSPGQEGSGGGGANFITTIYTIVTKETVCVNQPVQVTILDNINRKAEGMVNIFYERNKRHIIEHKVMIKNGQFTFIPTKEGTYIIAFEKTQKIINAKKCREIEKPFASMLEKEQKTDTELVKAETEEQKLVKRLLEKEQSMKKPIKTEKILSEILSLVLVITIILLIINFYKKQKIERKHFAWKKIKK